MLQHSRPLRRYIPRPIVVLERTMPQIFNLDLRIYSIAKKRKTFAVVIFLQLIIAHKCSKRAISEK